MQFEPITELRPERDVLRCLAESDDAKRALLAHQGAIGIGAYEEGLFVGSQWFYRVESRNAGCPLAPDHIPDLRPEDFRRQSVALGIPDDAFPLLVLNCLHVGRTKATEDTDEPDPSYFRRGIGTHLLQAACAWAGDRDYRSVVTTSGIDGFPEYTVWAGRLPLRVYLRNGFTILANRDPETEIPGHLRGEADKIDRTTLAMADVFKRLRTEQQP